LHRRRSVADVYRDDVGRGRPVIVRRSDGDLSCSGAAEDVINRRATPDHTVLIGLPGDVRTTAFVVDDVGLEMRDVQTTVADARAVRRLADLHLGWAVDPSVARKSLERSQLRFDARHGTEAEARPLHVAAPEDAVKVGRDEGARRQIGAAPTEDGRATVSRTNTGLDPILAE